MIAKKSIETGEDCDSIPESMRQYLAMHFDPNKTGGRDLFGRTGGLAGYGSSSYSSESTHSGKIGKWDTSCCTTLARLFSLWIIAGYALSID
jgi:hypothetical protein